jgi:hypothetical protein
LPALKLRTALVVLAALVMCGAFVAPVIAASKPSIRAVALYSDSEFGAVTIIVFGAKDVVVCVSRRCKPAFRSSVAGVWGAPASGLPRLRKGQTREVIVFAAGAGGASFLVRRVVVK